MEDIFFSDRFFLALCCERRKERKNPLEKLGESSRYSSFFLKASQTNTAGWIFFFTFIIFSTLFLALASQKIGDAIRRRVLTRAPQRGFSRLRKC